MNPTIPSPVRIQCQVADRSSSERTAESERPKSLGDGLSQELTNATPITSIPPASKPRTRQGQRHQCRVAAPQPGHDRSCALLPGAEALRILWTGPAARNERRSGSPASKEFARVRMTLSARARLASAA